MMASLYQMRVECLQVLNVKEETNEVNFIANPEKRIRSF